MDVDERAQGALKFWSDFWCQGDAPPVFGGEALPRICASRVRNVPKRLPTDKATGLDHWHPRELQSLADGLVGELADVYYRAEREGRWPGCSVTPWWL